MPGAIIAHRADQPGATIISSNHTATTNPTGAEARYDQALAGLAMLADEIGRAAAGLQQLRGQGAAINGSTARVFIADLGKTTSQALHACAFAQVVAEDVQPLAA